jgi:hypothetical protein
MQHAPCRYPLAELGVDLPRHHMNTRASLDQQSGFAFSHVASTNKHCHLAVQVHEYGKVTHDIASTKLN